MDGKIDNTHDLINIFGIRIKIKKNFQKQYKKLVNRIKKSDKKIKVVFLVSENQKWSYQGVYDLLEKDDRFEPLVLISLLTEVHNGTDKTRNNLEENYNFFKSRGMNVEYCYTNGDYVPLEEFNPDIVFYEQPWDLPAIYEPENVSNFALTAYVPYFLDVADNVVHYSVFQQRMWKFFIDSDLNFNQYKKYNKSVVKNTIVTGYPKLDVYFDNSNIDLKKYWKNLEKKKIIYAPHHSLSGSPHFATFQYNGQFILDFAKQHPETTWIFKPHPRFKYSVIENNFMTEEEINNYYEEWAKIGNIYTQGDYFDIFKSSDLMITDCSSFLAEYLPTGKPLIRLINKNANPLNQLGEKIAHSLYCVETNQELINILNELLVKGNDYKKEKRIKVCRLFMNKDVTAANKIYSCLKSELSK